MCARTSSSSSSSSSSARFTRASAAALFAAAAVLFALSGCNGSSSSDDDHDHADGTHTHADGTVHKDGDDHDDDAAGGGGADTGGGGHAHDEVSLGTVTIGDLEVELAQGHGGVAPGKECHLVVKLPYNDHGATIVRAWIGTSDRLASIVGRGTYAASHDDYDIHATAPDPLPAGAQWWIEIEKPDGSTLTGSADAIMD